MKRHPGCLDLPLNPCGRVAAVGGSAHAHAQRVDELLMLIAATECFLVVFVVEFHQPLDRWLALVIDLSRTRMYTSQSLSQLKAKQTTTLNGTVAR